MPDAVQAMIAYGFATFDLARIEEVRRNWPFLRDRRTDAYSGIQHRFLTD